MATISYNARVAYPALPTPTLPDRRVRKTSSEAIRGILVGVPIAALLWAPIIWGVSRLI